MIQCKCEEFGDRIMGEDDCIELKDGPFGIDEKYGFKFCPWCGESVTPVKSISAVDFITKVHKDMFPDGTGFENDD